MRNGFVTTSSCSTSFVSGPVCINVCNSPTYHAGLLGSLYLLWTRVCRHGNDGHGPCEGAILLPLANLAYAGKSIHDLYMHALAII